MNQITVDFSQVQGKMKIMHAVNNGPVGVCATRGFTNWKAHQEAEIPYARNHDASFYHGYGGEYTVDVHRIFRDFDADVNDPASYDFLMTDRYVSDTEAVGTRTFYRLGARIEHEPRKMGTFPPKDFQKWAEICEHIIRHYTEGWADGFTYNIEYWEIWNEPDCGEIGQNPCWQGTKEEFMDFFCIALRHLKSKFPHLKIGGPAFCNAWRDEYNDLLFTALNKEGLSMDFFSFHGYWNEPYKYAEDGEHAYQALEKYGFAGKLEMILNEWNYCRSWYGEGYLETQRAIKGLKGASFVVGTMCTGQNSKLDMMMYYDARPTIWNGMFDTSFLTPLKGYYPFKMYSQLYKMGTQVAADSDERSLYTLAAKGQDACGVLFTYFVDDDTAPAKEIALELKNCPLGKKNVEIYLLDEQNDLTLVRTEKITSGNFTLYFNAKLYSSYFLRIVP